MDGKSKLRPCSERVILSRDITNTSEEFRNIFGCQSDRKAVCVKHVQGSFSQWKIALVKGHYGPTLNILRALKSQAKELEHYLVANGKWQKALWYAHNI